CFPGQSLYSHYFTTRRGTGERALRSASSSRSRCFFHRALSASNFLSSKSRALKVVDFCFMVLLRFVERSPCRCNRALATLPGRLFLLGLMLSPPLLFLEVEGGLADPLVIDGLGSRLARSRSRLLWFSSCIAGQEVAGKFGMFAEASLR